jgi:hypothetical protein
VFLSILRLSTPDDSITTCMSNMALSLLQLSSLNGLLSYRANSNTPNVGHCATAMPCLVPWGEDIEKKWIIEEKE